MTFGFALLGLFFAQFLFGFGWGMVHNIIRSYLGGWWSLSLRAIKIIMVLAFVLVLVVLESIRLVYLEEQLELIIRTASIIFVFVSSVLYGMYVGEHQKWVNPIQFVKLILDNKD